MTRISLHYCSAERWRDLKERISICQLSPAFAPLLHLSQTSQWSLRMLQDTLNKAHGWVEPCLHHSGFLLAVVQPDNRIVQGVNHRRASHRDQGWIWKDMHHDSWHGGVVLIDYPQLYHTDYESIWCVHGAENTVIYWSEGTVFCYKI